jgi:antitoxin component YwqK of YwqJK toxin-antitoxin module
MNENLKIEYYYNGKVKSIIPLYNGKVHGTIKDYYPNGNIEGELEVRKNKPHGTWRSYSGLGRLTMEMKFYNGWLRKWMVMYNKNSGSTVISENIRNRYLLSMNIDKAIKLIIEGLHETHNE